MKEAKPILEIQDLHVDVEGKTVIKGADITIFPGEVHAIMGKNGSGKTTLANALIGHPRYIVTRGDILFKGESVLTLPPEERARKRIFLAFQNPTAVPGVTVAEFLRASLLAVRKDEIEPKKIRALIREEVKHFGVPETFLTRYLNDGFSGGEKKKLEMLQMRLLKPELVVLDETDSGLDIDSLKRVSECIEEHRDGSRGILIITHYQRLLEYVKPDRVHVFIDGKVIKSGGPELALELETHGYGWAERDNENIEAERKQGV